MTKQERQTAKSEIVLAFRNTNLMSLTLETLAKIKELVDADPKKD